MRIDFAKLMKRTLLGLVPGCWLAAATGFAADWPQYRGPLGDGISHEAIRTNWPAEGPKVWWRASVQDAFGSFAIQGDRAFFLSTTNDSEACFALGLKSGQPLWATELGRTIGQSSGGTGPRSTPVADGERIYTYGTYLQLSCLKAADGSKLWQQDVARDFAGQLNTQGISNYGNAASPLVEGGLVLVPGGGDGKCFLAFDKLTGKPVWQRETEPITHATPVAATIAGVRQIIFLTKNGLVSLEPLHGEVLWRFAFPSRRPVAASPVVGGDLVYCSAGYGVGAAVCRVERNAAGAFTARELWRTPGANMNHFSTPVIHDGYLYGLYGTMMTDTAPLECVELATGKRMWSGPPFGEGELILVDGKLVVQGSHGELAIVQASAEGYHELARAHVIGGRAWGFPAFGNGVLLHRSNKEIAALDLAAL